MNNRYILCALASILFCSLTACSGNSVEPGVPPPPDLSFSEKSTEALKSADQDKIEAVHCDAETDNDLEKAQADFGCFMMKATKMFEGAAISDMLLALGEPPIHVQEDILSATNPNSICSKFATQTGSKKYFGEFPKIPFNTSVNFGNTTPPKFFKEMLRRIKAGNIPFSRFRDDIYALDGNLSELIELLSLPRATSGFTFTIPKETCQVKKDIVVRNIDLEGFYALLGSLKIFANLINAYDIGLDPQTFVTSTGSINHAEFVKDANEGTDGQVFLALRSGAGHLSSIQPLMLGVTNSIIAFVDGVKSKADSDVFWAYVKRHSSSMNELKKYALDIKKSIENPSVMTPMTQSSHPDIKIDVNRFLAALPNPEAVESDPFALTVGQRVKFVASFFKTLFNGIASY